MKRQQTDLLDLFVKEANRYPVLSREQEANYAKQYREKPSKAVENILVSSNLRFVLKVAHEYKGYGLLMSDLVQEGSIGLLMAVRKFEPERGFRLISYAVWWIRAYIQNYLLRNWSVVKMGTTQVERSLFYKLRTTRSEMETELKRDVTYEELAERLHIAPEKIEDVENRLQFRDVSINMSMDQDHSPATFQDMTPGEEPDPLDIAILKQERIKIHQAIFELMKSLKPKERVVVLERLMTEEPKTLESIGNEQGVSRERIRQIETNVLRKLKAVFVGKQAEAAA